MMPFFPDRPRSHCSFVFRALEDDFGARFVLLAFVTRYVVDPTRRSFDSLSAIRWNFVFFAFLIGNCAKGNWSRGSSSSRYSAGSTSGRARFVERRKGFSRASSSSTTRLSSPTMPRSVSSDKGSSSSPAKRFACCGMLVKSFSNFRFLLDSACFFRASSLSFRFFRDADS